ncbi:angiopoietin-related protein 2-like [Cheilinus undulatus]|uniref:angiopoietin-related protein 2-like n=1 Tax=Cheilinus undulatus TaxID=241271 RepID=UPI001BD24721|nr:angiopoietin-related protein 2-like [Cheilinus undulatus]XP_041667738.1 angiopoietin-related protein 2-like [Cheilinus undulatus]XP_041667739.1 angiopoietin-related protein 2-like [Cheilinus undulatus]XP_041667740.1 angiopoietin-related protein 2-like [Cheilinus undulatus]
MILSVLVLLLVLVLSGPESSLQDAAQEIGASDDILERDFLYAQTRQKRAVVDHSATQTDKCSYTFIVPQQKNTGAICVNSKEPDALLENRVNKQELELLNSELAKQRLQIETLQQLVEVDGGLINEVKLLRKESRNMNSRVTQLYMQLLHEIIRKRDNALEASQLETRVLNQTNEMGRLTTRYRDLEIKYQHLSELANNQSALLQQLEESCRRGGGGPYGGGGTYGGGQAFGPGQAYGAGPAYGAGQVYGGGQLYSGGHQTYGSVQEKGRAVRPQPPVLPAPPALSPGGYRPFHPPTYTRHSSHPMTNEIQNDQNAKALPPPLPTMPSSIYSFTNEPSGPFRDCLEALENRYSTSGMYLLKPDNSNKLMQVWCDQRHDPGGWTVIQRRQDGSVNFFRNWETYKQGFGNMDGEYWLGLDNIYWLTNQGTYKLLVTLEDWSGRKTFAEYASFRVEPESDFYKLRVGRYHGNAGDSLTWHNGKQFTTLDRDHDIYAGNCAHYQKGGWWYNACAHSNLNGVWYRGGHYKSRYQDGVYWAEFRGGSYSLKKVTMMIRPNGNTFQ